LLRRRAAQLTVGDPREADTDIGTYAGADPVPEVVAVEPDDPRFTDPPDAPLLAVVVAPDTESAIALSGRDGPVSVWARDPAQGERIARRLAAPHTWVGRHGIAATAVGTRVARHVVPRQLEWRATWAPGTPKLPTDDDLVAAQRTQTELRHGRESRRWPALRAGARALVRTAKRER